MLMPEEAAQGFIAALQDRSMNFSVISNSKGPRIEIQDRPTATVQFKLDQLGEIRVEFVFDDRPVEVLPFVQGGGDVMADYVVRKIAGSGGGQASAE